MPIPCATGRDCDAANCARLLHGPVKDAATGTMPALLPRYLQAGPAQLDLFHRDIQIGDRWARLHPREFAVLWEIVAAQGATLSNAYLLHTIWRMRHDPGSNRVAVHISRIRAKLRPFGLDGLVGTDPNGGYRLGVCPLPAAHNSALDSGCAMGNGASVTTGR